MLQASDENFLIFCYFPLNFTKLFLDLSSISFAIMGDRFLCMTKKESKDNGSRSKRMCRSQRKLLAEEEFLHRQALSLALQQHQLSQRFDGSMSRRIGSTSSRRRTLSDPFSNGKQVLELGVGTKLSLSWKKQDCFLVPLISQVLGLI
ncbi:methyl esterase 12 [Quillaja saponaria]|uniref:Methyl esterase 12 n=1 Tax=Quillaja saponaria TaxID=32244 RepID=A0AAD7QJL8_QUISA|nr:methyl esterase 12 [Quillaja saponaria]